MENTEKHEVEVLSQNSLSTITKAEIDIQISTAHAYPRSMKLFKERATEMVTMDVETAEKCIYRRPVGKEKNKVTGQWEEKFAEGKSIRMAEIIASSFGNVRVGATIIDRDSRSVTARGFCHDLESNYAATSDCIESTVKADGTPYSERMAIVIAKAALSKARRDATFMVIPGALCKTIEDAARETALGKGQTMEQRRANVLSWIKKLAIDEKRVWAALSIKGIEDCGIEEMTTLIGLKTAIQDKEITIEEAFPKNDTTFEDLKELFESKFNEGIVLVDDGAFLLAITDCTAFTDAEKKDFYRIINTKEVNSYKKLQTLLMSK